MLSRIEEVGLNHGAIIHGWYYIVYVVSLYSIMDVIKDVEEVGLNHGAIIHGWYYIVYVVSLYSIMDVISMLKK